MLVVCNHPVKVSVTTDHINSFSSLTDPTDQLTELCKTLPLHSPPLPCSLTSTPLHCPGEADPVYEARHHLVTLDPHKT